MTEHFRCKVRCHCSYGANETDQYRPVAGYVDRILKGDKAADLPVHAPTKYEMVMNSRQPNRSLEDLGYEQPSIDKVVDPVSRRKSFK